MWHWACRMSFAPACAGTRPQQASVPDTHTRALHAHAQRPRPAGCPFQASAAGRQGLPEAGGSSDPVIVATDTAAAAARAGKLHRAHRLPAPRHAHDRGQNHASHRHVTPSHTRYPGCSCTRLQLHRRRRRPGGSGPLRRDCPSGRAASHCTSEMQRGRRGSLGDALPARMLRRATLAAICVLAIAARLHKVG